MCDDNQAFIEFYYNFFFVKDISMRRILMQGQVRRSLYHLTSFVLAFDSSSSPSTQVAILNQWHSILGHPSYSTISIVNKNTIIVSSTFQILLFCKHFQTSKSYKLSFSSHSEINVTMFELLFLDFWCYFEISCNGNKYFLNIVHDFTHFT